MTRSVESSRRQPALLLDLAVGLYLLGTGVALLFSVGWAMAPFENVDPGKSHELVLIGLALGALTAAGAMARGVWRNHPALVRAPLAVSLVCLAAWVIALPPI
jgi:hypothetical protein